MKVKSVTPEEVTEAVLPDTTPIMDTSAVPAPSSKKRSANNASSRLLRARKLCAASGTNTCSKTCCAAA